MTRDDHGRLHQLRVSDHARLRYLQRVGIDESPGDAIRRLVHRGQEIAHPDIHGRAIQAGDALLVERGGAIVTILNGGDECAF